MTLADIKGDLHLHTAWSDGTASVAEMAAEALRRGYDYVVMSDHTQSLGVANGLTWERFQERRQEILEQIKDESYAEPKTFTFEDFATEWLEQRLSLRGWTASAYASIIRRHLIPYFGKMKLSAIWPNVVQRFVIDLSLQQVSSKTFDNNLLDDQPWVLSRNRAGADVPKTR